MDFEQYETWAMRVCHILLDLLDKEGIAEVQQTCQTLGADRLREICNVKHADVRAFLSMPDRRWPSILRRIEDRAERHAFLIAATYEVRCALALLGQLCSYGMTGSAGIGKSFLMLQAAAAAQELHQGFPGLWPFSEGDPLGEGLEDF